MTLKLFDSLADVELRQKQFPVIAQIPLRNLP
jgi:hypothetical protein